MGLRQNNHWAERIPVFGKLVTMWMNYSHEWDHIERVWGPMEHSIVKQLESRPPLSEQDQQPRKERVMSALAKAVCNEKGIDPVRQLHPLDPGELIFGGSYDDISPWQFRMNLEKFMGIELNKEIANKIVDRGMTAGDIVELVLNQEPH